jgi:lysophospholipase L1-like esterase
MNRSLAPLVLTAALALPAIARAAGAEKPPFADDIAAFEAADRAKAPPQGAVLFVGSSSIRFWESLPQDFPGVETLDRGFGGSTVADCVRYADRIVVPYHPRRIVFYAGDNDVAAGRSPRQIAADFSAFVRKVRAALPGVPILFISIKPSLARWKLAAAIRKTNALIRADAAREKFDYLDVYAPMLGADGLPRKELFREDGLHMTAAGYALWTKSIDSFVRGGVTPSARPAP